MPGISSALTPAERAVLEALLNEGVRFMVVGLSAAVLQGADTATQNIDLWFEDLADERLADAVEGAGAVWVSGTFGMRPPQIGGPDIERLDVVTHMHGLGPFDDEVANTIEVKVDGLLLRVLRLDRIIASKEATARNKDLAVLPALRDALAAQTDG